MYINDYTNVNQLCWTPAVVQKKLSWGKYYCIIAPTKRVIKRHINLVRNSINSVETMSSDRELKTDKSTGDSSREPTQRASKQDSLENQGEMEEPSSR